jgi:uncharacterized membrane protein YhaH (DUF805 family)
MKTLTLSVVILVMLLSCKTENNRLNYIAKVNFELINIGQSSLDSADSVKEENPIMGLIVYLILSPICMFLCYIIAKKKNFDVKVWVLLALWFNLYVLIAALIIKKKPVPIKKNDNIREVLFSFKGRISKNIYFKYWFFTLSFWIISTFCIIGISVLLEIKPEIYLSIFAIITCVFCWPFFALFAKRMHDRNLSPWLILLVAVPIVNIFIGLWLATEFWKEGTDEDNRYGSNPLY